MKSKIVLLEDDPDLQYIYAEILSMAGHDVVCFKTIHDFKKGIYSLDVQLFLCDVYLPDGSGVDVCNELKSSPAWSTSPVVMMSAYVTNNEIIQKCLPDAVVAKPFGLSYLTNVVGSLIFSDKSF